MKRTIRYSLAKAKDCYDHDGRKITAVTITTTDGSDEAYAAKRADAKGTNVTEELIRVSLVSYERANGSALTVVTEDGEAVQPSDEKIAVVQPFEALDRWGTKARNFVVAAFKSISIPDEDEFASFFASASEV